MMAHNELQKMLLVDTYKDDDREHTFAKHNRRLPPFMNYCGLAHGSAIRCDQCGQVFAADKEPRKIWNHIASSDCLRIWSKDLVTEHFLGRSKYNSVLEQAGLLPIMAHTGEAVKSNGWISTRTQNWFPSWGCALAAAVFEPERQRNDIVARIGDLTVPFATPGPTKEDLERHRIPTRVIACVSILFERIFRSDDVSEYVVVYALRRAGMSPRELATTWFVDWMRRNLDNGDGLRDLILLVFRHMQKNRNELLDAELEDASKSEVTIQ